VNCAEENTANFVKVKMTKLLFSAPHSMYTVTLNELKAVLKVRLSPLGTEATNWLIVPAPDDDDC
jgi:hypothetical protein